LLRRHLTDAEIRENFDEALSAALWFGQPCPQCATGFGTWVMDAVNAVAADVRDRWPALDVDVALIGEANFQLDSWLEAVNDDEQSQRGTDRR
jgi:hypothetical protein